MTYAQGCERWSTDQSGFAEAISAAEAADVAVVVVGTWSVSTFIHSLKKFSMSNLSSVTKLNSGLASTPLRESILTSRPST